MFGGRQGCLAWPRFSENCYFQIRLYIYIYLKIQSGIASVASCCFYSLPIPALWPERNEIPKPPKGSKCTSTLSTHIYYQKSYTHIPSPESELLPATSAAHQHWLHGPSSHIAARVRTEAMKDRLDHKSVDEHRDSFPVCVLFWTRLPTRPN